MNRNAIIDIILVLLISAVFILFNAQINGERLDKFGCTDAQKYIEGVICDN